eukprot:1093572-Rhodomonas_salina.1
MRTLRFLNPNHLSVTVLLGKVHAVAGFGRGPRNCAESKATWFTRERVCGNIAQQGMDPDTRVGARGSEQLEAARG